MHYAPLRLLLLRLKGARGMNRWHFFFFKSHARTNDDVIKNNITVPGSKGRSSGNNPLTGGRFSRRM